MFFACYQTFCKSYVCGESRFPYQTCLVARSLVSRDILQLVSICHLGATVVTCDYYERSEYVLVSFVVKVSVHFRVIDCDIKLTHDALKELVAPNFL